MVNPPIIKAIAIRISVVNANVLPRSNFGVGRQENSPQSV